MHRLLARLPHQHFNTGLTTFSRLGGGLNSAPLLHMHFAGSSLTGLDLPRPASTLCRAPLPAPPAFTALPQRSTSLPRVADHGSASCGLWQSCHDRSAVSASAAAASPSVGTPSSRQLGGREPSGHNGAADGDDFLSPSATFEGLGLHADVIAALEAAGLQRPSQVQAQAVPPLLSGRDAVIAAETGSGKTLAYLAPLVSRMLAGRQQGGDGSAAPDGENRGGAATSADNALILCPSVALCEQVAAVARGLRRPDGEPLVSVAFVSSSQRPPHRPPDVTIATPGGLHQLLHGAWYGQRWSREGLPARTAHLVLDEADALLGGGFRDHTERILELFRTDDRLARRQQASAELGVGVEALKALPRAVRQAAASGGLPKMREAGFTADMLAAHEERPAADLDEWLENPSTSGRDAEVVRSRDWRRQYVFVAATMPAEGKKSTAAELREGFPEAVWLSGARLHRAQRRVAHRWVPVAPGDWETALVEAVTGEAAMRDGRGRTLVFARDVGAAQAAHRALYAAGLDVLSYHRDVPPAQRADALEAVASEEGTVLVCTDSAARGIDIPGVTHVVQADFAATAIDFLHRVGRTGRAGKDGAVTSLVSDESRDLADAIRQAVETGQPVEGAFSRNRSFRKKFKRYGKYVPRGQAASRA